MPPILRRIVCLPVEKLSILPTFCGNAELVDCVGGVWLGPSRVDWCSVSSDVLVELTEKLLEEYFQEFRHICGEKFPVAKCAQQLRTQPAPS